MQISTLSDYFKNFYTKFPNLTPIQEKAIQLDYWNRNRNLSVLRQRQGKNVFSKLTNVDNKLEKFIKVDYLIVKYGLY